MKNTFALILAAAISHVALCDVNFPAPTAETKPWGICHWLGNAIERQELEKEMKRWADAGLGGIRIIPIYGAKGYEDKYVEFMSPKFVEILEFANEIAAKNGMKVDLSFGAGWCFGGKTIPPELGAQGLKVLTDGDKAPKHFKVLWEGAGKRLVSYRTGQKVKRAQDLDAGPMLNPFSPAALEAHLRLFKNLDGRNAAYPRATFHDSFEYYNAGWSDEFPALFRKYRGYDIMDHLAELAGEGERDAVAKVKHDYRETLSDILSKETFPIWTNWCRERGILTHNQAHGAPANLLEFYAIADVPETEMFGRGDRDKFKSGFTKGFREGDRSILMSKFASSAAHLTGKKSVSAESFTWMTEHFCETLEEVKAFGDLLFLSGVNRLYYHATVYSPDSAPWPGWCFYAASELNPRNPIWRDIKPLNEYFTRVQSVLAEATPDNDVLLYWPIDDQWWKADGFEELLTVHAHWMEDIPFGRLAQSLADNGYQFDYVSDAFLKDDIVARYKAIVVPEAKHVKPGTLARLKELSKRMPVVFERDGDPIAALAKTEAEPLNFATKDTPFDAIRLNWKGGKLYFVVNSSTERAKLALPEKAELLSPLYGNAIPVMGGEDGGWMAHAVSFGPAASFFVWAKEGAPGCVKQTVKERRFGSRVPLGPWSLEFIKDVSGWELPAKRANVALGDWTKLGEREAEFSGTAVYRTEFEMKADDLKSPFLLSLGEVGSTARVVVNGQLLQTLFMHPYEATIPKEFLKEGRNLLEVEVTNLGANRIRAYDRKGVQWKTFRDANMAIYRGKGVLDASEWPVLPSGLIGPVEVMSLSPSKNGVWPDGSAMDAWFDEKPSVDEAKLGRRYRAEEFGAKADAEELQTAALQCAINKIGCQGGGVLVLGKGVWNTSSLFFRAGVHLKIERGGVLKGPKDGALTPRLETRMEGETICYNAALVNADRCDGFTLYGEGMIDGNGRDTWAAFWHGRKRVKGFRNTALDRPRNVYVSNSRDVRVDGLTIKDSHFWTTHYYKCERVRISNLRITAPGAEDPPKAPSSDAIDLDVVKDCHIWDCYMDVNDDGIALKGGKYYQCEKLPQNGGNERILVEGCTFGPVTHSALTCGSEAVHCKNIIVRNCMLMGPDNLLNLKSRPDTVQLYEDILVEHVSGRCNKVVQAKPWNQYFTLPEGVGKQSTTMRNIVFRDCRAKAAINVKPDPDFMSMDEIKYEGCDFD